MKKSPLIIVCAGGGGVGKTTTSSALSLAFAREGLRTLVVTVDPARRLATALGVDVDTKAHPIYRDPETEDRLWALMPEPAQATRSFVEDLFRDEPAALARLLDNKLYQVIEDKLAGMHELAAVALLLQTLRDHELDLVVIDTAPSRHALDFMRYPQRLAKLLEGRAIVWLSKLAERNDGTKRKSRLRILSWGRARVEDVMGRVLGVQLIRDLAALFSELSIVRERFADLANNAIELLLGEATRYLLVSATTGAARADVSFLIRSLHGQGRKAHAILLNRAQVHEPYWAETLKVNPNTTPAMHTALERLDNERRFRTKAANYTRDYFSAQHPSVLLLPLPYVEADNPTAIVRTLADALSPHLKNIRG